MRRVGLVADTHVGEFVDALPPRVCEVLQGCALILHAGDLSRVRVLDDLAAVAPVLAVRGDHDTDAGHLPARLVTAVGGWRIGLVHGSRGRTWDTAVTLAQCAAGRPLPWRRPLHRRLAASLGPVDALVYGHWHAPAIDRVGPALCVCPGAVTPWGSLEGGAPPRPGAPGVADRVVGRFRRILGPDAMRPRVGVLEVGSAGIRPRLIPLDGPAPA
ncbi:MAG TPA: metallophosphoesterase family protein [Miltoncostaeaceae bacterium]|nr:metallophosphoesterase family protein [Miltoncostaeaceae bacterium]